MRHPHLTEAIKKIVDRARAAGKYVGAGMGPDPAYAAWLANLGVQWLQVGGDDSYMIQAADQARREVVRRLDDMKSQPVAPPLRPSEGVRHG